MTYRDHSRRSLGVGSRWAVAGWSRYAPTCSLALAVAATRPAERFAGRVVDAATEELARTYRDHSEPSLGAGSRWGRCRVVSIRADVLAGARRRRYSTSGAFCWSSSRLRRGTRREVTYRDHSRRSLGVGSRWAVAGWSRYVRASQARSNYSTGEAFRWSSASTSASEGRCIETTPGGRWGLARAELLPGGLDTSELRKLARTTRPAKRFAGRVARSRDEGACSGRIETTPGGRCGSARAGPLPGGLDTRRRARWRSPSPLLDQRNGPIPARPGTRGFGGGGTLGG